MRTHLWIKWLAQVPCMCFWLAVLWLNAVPRLSCQNWLTSLSPTGLSHMQVCLSLHPFWGHQKDGRQWGVAACVSWKFYTSLQSWSLVYWKAAQSTTLKYGSADDCIKGAEVRLLYIYNLQKIDKNTQNYHLLSYLLSCILFGLSCLCPVPDQLHVVCNSLMQHKRSILTAWIVYVISSNVCTCVYNYFFHHSQDCLWQCQWTCCRSAIKFVAL